MGSGASIWWPWWALATLQERHLWRTVFIAWLARKIQNSSLSSDRTTRTPRWWRRMCDWQIYEETKWCLPSSRSGWRKSLGKSAHCNRPPSRIRPSTTNGLNRVIFDSLGRAAFLGSEWSSTEGNSAWTAFIQCWRLSMRSDAVNLADDRWACLMFRMNRKIRALTRSNLQY